MYTFHKEHLTWQQAVGHEVKDRFKYRLINDEKYYDLDRNERYLTKLEDIRMKRFYGKHLHKYMGDTRPELTNHETGVGGTFGPLTTTNFFNKHQRSISTNPTARHNKDALLKELNMQRNRSSAKDGVFKKLG